jgi:hypothetical protein
MARFDKGVSRFAELLDRAQARRCGEVQQDAGEDRRFQKVVATDTVDETGAQSALKAERRVPFLSSGLSRHLTTISSSNGSLDKRAAVRFRAPGRCH